MSFSAGIDPAIIGDIQKFLALHGAGEVEAGVPGWQGYMLPLIAFMMGARWVMDFLDKRAGAAPVTRKEFTDFYKALHAHQIHEESVLVHIQTRLDLQHSAHHQFAQYLHSLATRKPDEPMPQVPPAPPPPAPWPKHPGI